MEIRKELIDELIATSGGSLIGPDGLVKSLTKALVERMLTGELNHHPGYEKHDVAGYGTGNSRNGTSRKTLKGEAGEMAIEVPRDRSGTFEPKLIEKHQTRFEGFDGQDPVDVRTGYDGAGHPRATCMTCTAWKSVPA